MKTNHRIPWLLLAGILALTACRSTRKARLELDKYTGTIKVACIGDSITYGAGIDPREVNAYPAVLGRELGDRFSVLNLGVSGATVLRQGDKPYRGQPEFVQATDFAPDIVIITLGTNDSKPQNWEHQNDFVKDFGDMIDHFLNLPWHPKIWVCLPLPAYETVGGIRDEVIYNEIIPKIRQVAHRRQVPIIDLYEALSERPDLFPDRIHPNAAGAKLMAQTIRDALLAP